MNRRTGEAVKSAGQQLYARARRRIPGGTQLLSKRPEQFLPDLWPSYYLKARGVEVWDLDGRKYTDMSTSGVGACVLGFADPDVDAAVQEAIRAGTMATLNCPEEVELAELLCEIHPWAEMVRFARGGGEAMAIAVRIARARTRRDKVAFCGYHGWHDWYLAANLGADDTLDGHLLPGLQPLGVPRALADSALTFRYNHADDLVALAEAHGDELAAIVLEPVRNHEPGPGFLAEVKTIARGVGAVLVFDEVTSGWRLTTGGAHLTYGVTPDMAVFAKAMGNGYPSAAVIGVGDAMQAAQDTFISSTAWTERIGPTAALATIRKHRENNVAKHLMAVGQRVQACWSAAAARAHLAVEITGIPPLSHLSFRSENGRAVRTLFTQLLLERGFLAGSAFYATYAHQEDHLRSYAAAVEEAFDVLGQALERGAVERLLKGPVAHSGFQRLA